MDTCIRVRGFLFPCFRAVLIVFAALFVAAVPSAAQDEGAEAHYSPYTAPTAFDPEQQVHIIVRGDNLWNLAARFYGDPLLWPQIWDANRYITDAHWIYPGDPLVIPGSPDVAAERMVGGEEEFGDEPLPEEAVDVLGEEPVPPEEMVDPGGAGDGVRIEGLEEAMVTPGTLVNEVDVYCAPLILPDLEMFQYAITGAEEGDKVSQGNGDVVYIDGGDDDGISAEDRFFVYQKFRKVRHPETRRPLGWAFRHVAEVTVLCTNAGDATAVISAGCAEVHVGDLLMPWEELPIPVVDATAPLGRCGEPGGGAEGYVVYNLDDQATVAAGNMVVIDRGSDDGVAPGDFFAVFRMQDGHQLLLGEGVVVRTERATATMKLHSTVREIHVGDRVDLK